MNVVAIVGRPNVGKSTLFNRIIERREAIVEAVPGVTRDRLYAQAEWNGKVFTLVDTGGIVPESEEMFDSAIRRQAMLAIDEADSIIFVVDAVDGVTPTDIDIARLLQSSHKPVILVANKCDNVERDAHAAEFYSLGFSTVYPMSAMSGRASGDVLDAVTEPLIVTPIAGTTRDKITETIQVEGIPINIIDTAGIRNDTEADGEVERIGISRTWAAVEQADVVLHILDASRGPTRADEEIVNRLPTQVPLLRIWNKIDLSGHKPSVDVEPDVTHIYLSASEKLGMDLLRKELLRLAGWQQTGESIYLARERHLIALRAAQAHLQTAAELAAQRDSALDLFAEELRLTQERLNSITGVFTSDDLLGVIFSRFCIGK